MLFVDDDGTYDNDGSVDWSVLLEDETFLLELGLLRTIFEGCRGCKLLGLIGFEYASFGLDAALLFCDEVGDEAKTSSTSNRRLSSSDITLDMIGWCGDQIGWEEQRRGSEKDTRFW